MSHTDANAQPQFSQLRRAKEERLKDLLKRKPGQKHYRRALRAYLEADAGVQKAIIHQLGLDSGA